MGAQTTVGSIWPIKGAHTAHACTVGTFMLAKPGRTAWRALTSALIPGDGSSATPFHKAVSDRLLVGSHRPCVILRVFLLEVEDEIGPRVEAETEVELQVQI